MRYLFAALLSISIAVPSLAADSPWNGTWKFSDTKSKLTGETFTITTKPDGAYHYSNGSTIEYDFACDGKSYPTLSRMVTCTGEPATGLDFTFLADKTPISKIHRSFSADGKTMTSNNTYIYPDGSTATDTQTYERLSKTTGLAGTWKNVKEKTDEQVTLVLSVLGDVISMDYPKNQVKINGKLDGSDSIVTGPTIPKGALESLKADGPSKIHAAAKFKDKVLWEGIFTLSADGKTLKMERWPPGKMSEKEVQIYEKQ